MRSTKDLQTDCDNFNLNNEDEDCFAFIAPIDAKNCLLFLMDWANNTKLNYDALKDGSYLKRTLYINKDVNAYVMNENDMKLALRAVALGRSTLEGYIKKHS